MAFPYCIRQGRHNLPGPCLCPRLRRQTGDFLRHSLEIRTPTVETDPRPQGSLAVGVRIFSFSLVACLLGSVHAEDLSYGRLTMVDNGEETGMRDCIRQAAEAASQEDLDTYISCFTDSQKKPMRRRAAMLFVRHTVKLELLDCHLVEEFENHATWAIKYKALLTGAGYDVVSLLHMQKENDAWRISREQVETSEKSKPTCNADSSVPAGCRGGQCRLVVQ